MKSKSPSHYDGKPIGAAADAKSAFHAGVTMGPDQVERMEDMRRIRNKLIKAGSKDRHRANVAAQSAEERDREWQQYKFRRNRATNMLKALRNGTKVDAVAHYWRVSPDDVLAEVKWIAHHRNRSGRRSRSKTPDGLPQRVTAR